MYIMVCGSMPYDDSNVKRMVRDQTEKKLGFSRSKKLTLDVKDLILKMLTPDPTRRATMHYLHHHVWVLGADGIHQAIPPQTGEMADGVQLDAAPRELPSASAETTVDGQCSSGCDEQVISAGNQNRNNEHPTQPHVHPQRIIRCPFAPKFIPI